MEKALKEVIEGGVDNVDDSQGSGGTSLTISGGKKRDVTKRVGNKASVTLRDKILEWGAFNEIYPDVDKLDKAGMQEMCKTVKLVIDSHTCLNPENTLEILKIMYNLPDEKLSKMFLQRFNFSASTKDALRSIYVNWVDHLESAVINYTKTRNAYIKKNSKKDPINKVEDLYKNWSAIDAYYNIQSSSPILLYSNFPKIPYELPWLRGRFTENDVWDVYPSMFYWGVSEVKETTKLENEIRQFTYLGFCPRRPKYRLKKLFDFPLDTLYKATEALGGKSSKHKYHEVLKMIEKSGHIKTPQFNIPQIKRKNPKGKTIQQKIKWYVEEIIKIYKILHPHFKEVESYYVEIAKTMSKIGFKIAEL